MGGSSRFGHALILPHQLCFIDDYYTNHDLSLPLPLTSPLSHSSCVTISSVGDGVARMLRVACRTIRRIASSGKDKHLTYKTMYSKVNRRLSSCSPGIFHFILTYFSDLHIDIFIFIIIIHARSQGVASSSPRIVSLVILVILNQRDCLRCAEAFLGARPTREKGLNVISSRPDPPTRWTHFPQFTEDTTHVNSFSRFKAYRKTRYDALMKASDACRHKVVPVTCIPAWRSPPSVTPLKKVCLSPAGRRRPSSSYFTLIFPSFLQELFTKFMRTPSPPNASSPAAPRPPSMLPTVC